MRKNEWKEGDKAYVAVDLIFPHVGIVKYKSDDVYGVEIENGMVVDVYESEMFKSARKRDRIIKEEAEKDEQDDINKTDEEIEEEIREMESLDAIHTIECFERGNPAFFVNGFPCYARKVVSDIERGNDDE